MSIIDSNSKNLDFHQTFKPEQKCLSNLLTGVDICSGKTVEEISKMTGIPTGSSSGKVAPTISYLTFMGIINSIYGKKKFELTYTDIGRCVLEEDPCLSEDLTLLLLHCMIVRNYRGAELWNYIVCKVFPKYNGKISKDNLVKELELKYNKEVNLTPFNGSYLGLFSPLEMISISDNEYVFQSYPVKKEFIYLYGLILFEYWDIWLSSFSEELESLVISEFEIAEVQLAKTGFRNAFAWSEKEEYQVLEALQDRHIISLNRQMTPFAVRKISTKQDLIKLLYSELC